MLPNAVPIPLFNFYPRPPRGGRPATIASLPRLKLFLSTPSARRATLRCLRLPGLPPEFLSTPSARRATINRKRTYLRIQISIHALREEGDTRSSSLIIADAYFYPRPPRGGRRVRTSFFLDATSFLSTPSARRATCGLQKNPLKGVISIHALREEGDRCGHPHAQGADNFYPRPPRGGRRIH